MKAIILISTMLLLSLTAYGQTPDFTYRQGYLFDPTTTGPDSIGVGAASVYQNIPGWDGAGVTVFDIEASWSCILKMKYRTNRGQGGFPGGRYDCSYFLFLWFSDGYSLNYLFRVMFAVSGYNIKYVSILEL